MEESLENRVDLKIIRYANCWEDADILLEALAPKEGGKYLSIASAGDNSFALLANSPSLVLAIDLNFSQLACVELKKEAFRHLPYEQMLQFLGVHAMDKRKECYKNLRESLTEKTKNYWDNHLDLIEKGIIHTGKFERYFSLFSRWVLPLIHSKKTITCLLEKKSTEERKRFYDKQWNTLAWKWLFKLFFSRKVMGKWGRDPEFFKYVETSVADRILTRVKHALTELPTDTNPYLEYILKGNFQKTLPFYLRAENFENIRKNLDQLVLFKGGLNEAFAAYPSSFDGFNLSDIFEYMSPEQYGEELTQIVDRSTAGARLAYWNMLAYRKEVPALSKLSFLDSERLHKLDKAFFYQAFVIGVVT